MDRSKWRVVITDCDHPDIDEEKETFGRIGAELIWADAREEEELIRVCQDADGLLNQYALMTRKVMENLPRCKVISRYGVGFDPVDLRAATDLGSSSPMWPDYCIDEVTVQTVTLLLSLIRKTVFFDQKVRAGQWDFRLGRPIHRIRGKTMGLVGCGRIGMEVARIVSSLGVKVMTYDPYIQKAGGEIESVELTPLGKGRLHLRPLPVERIDPPSDRKERI